MNPTTPWRPSYAIILRPAPGHWQAPPEQRLKGLLKVPLRAFGFRCEVCRPAEGVEPAKPSEAPSRPTVKQEPRNP